MKALLKRTISQEISIPLSGGEIADLFWELDEFGQADFFNRLGVFDLLPSQLQAITESENLTHKGRVVMDMIGEYSVPV